MSQMTRSTRPARTVPIQENKAAVLIGITSPEARERIWPYTHVVHELGRGDRGYAGDRRPLQAGRRRGGRRHTRRMGVWYVTLAVFRSSDGFDVMSRLRPA